MWCHSTEIYAADLVAGRLKPWLAAPYIEDFLINNFPCEFIKNTPIYYNKQEKIHLIDNCPL